MMVKEGYKEVNIGPLDYKVPVSWKVDYIGNIDDLELLSSGIDEFNGKKKYLSTSSIEKNKIIEVEELIKHQKRPSRANMQPVLNSVWFAKMKDTVKVYIYTEKNKNEIQDYIMSTGFIGIKCNNNIDVRYLNQYFLWEQFNKVKNIYSHGSTQQAVNMKDVRNLKIINPPLKEQKKIAAILSSVDETIEKTDQVIEKTKELKKGLMQELLTKGIGHDEFKKVRVGAKDIEIPIQWNVKKLSDISSNEKNAIVDGPFGSSINTKEDYIDTGIPVIRTVNIRPNKFVNEDLKFINEELFQDLKRSAIYPGDILLSKVGTIGNACILPKEIDKAILSTTGSCKITVDDSKCTEKFLCYVLNFYRPYMNRIASQSVQPFLNMKTIRNFRYAFPPLEEQKKIADILSTVDEKIQKEEEYKSKLEELKKGLMQKLLTGEVRVKVAN